MPEDKTNMEVSLFITLDAFKRDMDNALGIVKGWVRKIDRAVAKSKFGKTVSKWLAPIKNVATKATGVIRGFVRTAGTLFMGILAPVRLVAGAIIGVFTSLVGTVAKVLGRLVGIVTGIFKKITMIVMGFGLAIGAVLAYNMFKGIQENMELADWRMVLQKVYGKGAKAAEKYARQLSLKTPFTPMEMITTAAGLGAARLEYDKYMQTAVDWAAGSKAPLQMITMIMQRLASGQTGEALESARRALISAQDLMDEGIKFAKSGQVTSTAMETLAAIMRIVEKRFGGMAEAAAEVGSGPMSTLAGVIEDIRIQLTEPWYESWNDTIIAINGSLLLLSQSDKFKTLIEWSTKVRDSAELTVKSIWGWLKGRNWKEAWENLAGISKKGSPIRQLFGLLPKIGAMFAKINAETGKYEAGPLTAVVIAAFEVAVAKVREIFNILWNDVALDFRMTIAKQMHHIQLSLINAANKVQEAALDADAKRRYESLMAIRGKKDFPKWGALAEKGPTVWSKETYRKQARVPMREQVKIDAMREAAGGFGGMATALYDQPTETEATETQKAIAADQLRAAGNLNDAAKALKDAVAGPEGLWAATKAAASSAIPEKPLAGRRAEWLARKAALAARLKAEWKADTFKEPGVKALRERLLKQQARSKRATRFAGIGGQPADIQAGLRAKATREAAITAQMRRDFRDALGSVLRDLLVSPGENKRLSEYAKSYKGAPEWSPGMQMKGAGPVGQLGDIILNIAGVLDEAFLYRQLIPALEQALRTRGFDPARAGGK